MYLEDNVGAVNINLLKNELLLLDEIVPKNAAKGLRDPENTLNTVNR
ncbi:MAG: hypothetical protein P4L45_04640 [Ignavibacteriaceae bacterium]|nr:hypothetical protein [Ignavibacteriaceae bacterium]